MQQSDEGFTTSFHYRYDTDHILEFVSDQESEKEVEGTECQLTWPQRLQEHGQPMDQAGERKDTTYRDVLMLTEFNKVQRVLPTYDIHTHIHTHQHYRQSRYSLPEWISPAQYTGKLIWEPVLLYIMML
jgi:hypothetical protein